MTNSLNKNYARSGQTKTKLLAILWKHIEPRRKLQFGFLIVLIVLAAFAEVVSIGAVVPFLGALTAPDSIANGYFFWSSSGCSGGNAIVVNMGNDTFILYNRC